MRLETKRKRKQKWAEEKETPGAAFPSSSYEEGMSLDVPNSIRVTTGASTLVSPFPNRPTYTLSQEQGPSPSQEPSGLPVVMQIKTEISVEVKAETLETPSCAENPASSPDHAPDLSIADQPEVPEVLSSEEKGQRLCTVDMSGSSLVQMMQDIDYRPVKGKKPDWEKFLNGKEIKSKKREIRAEADEAMKQFTSLPVKQRQKASVLVDKGMRSKIAQVDNVRTHNLNVLNQATLWALNLGRQYVKTKEEAGLSDAEYRKLQKQLEANTLDSLAAFLSADSAN